MQLLARFFSRNAAEVNSQGRKPLDGVSEKNVSPNGATEAVKLLSPHWGLVV